MRNPRFSRNVSVLISILGALAIVLPFLLLPQPEWNTLRWMSFCYGMLLFAGGGIFACFAHQALRAKEALARGENVLAQWHVPPELWREFVDVDEAVQKSQNFFGNVVSLRDEHRHHGAKVIVGKEALQVDEQIMTLPRRSTPEVTQAAVVRSNSGLLYMEFWLFFPATAKTSSRTAVMRFPLPESSLPEAQAAAEYYRKGRPGDADFFHGAGDGTNPEDLSACVSCGYQTHKLASRCPQCGAGLLSKRWARRAGFILLLCGIAMSGLLGYLAYQVLPPFLNRGEEFSDTLLQTTLVLGFFSIMLAFSLTTLVYGAWQIWTGRRNLKVMMTMAWSFEAMLLIAILASYLS